LGDEVIELLAQPDFPLRFILVQGWVRTGRVLTEGGEKVAQTAFGGILTRTKTKKMGQISVAGLRQFAQHFRPIPPLAQLPAQQEEEGNGVEGHLSPRGPPPQLLRQDGTEAAEIHQMQQKLKLRQGCPGLRFLQGFVAGIGVPGTIVLLGRGGRLWRCGPVQGESCLQSSEATGRHEFSILTAGLGRCL